MLIMKTCNCPEDCDHQPSYVLSKEEMKDLYDYLKHQYISYDNWNLIKLVEQMGWEINGR